MSTHLFSARDMTCTVPSQDGEKTIFQGLSFDIDAGEIVDLVGPSGAGKSSLLTAFARLNPHAGGTMFLDGRPSTEFTPQQWRCRVAYLPQKPVLIGDNVAEVIRLPWTLAIRNEQDDSSSDTNHPADPQAHARTRGKRHRSGIWGAVHNGVDMLPDDKIRATLDAIGCEDIDLGRAPHDLSGGQAARVSLARTLLTDPKLLLADEVDAGLDDDNAAKVAAILSDAAQRGMAVIRIRHRPPDGVATRTVTLDEGGLR